MRGPGRSSQRANQKKKVTKSIAGGLPSKSAPSSQFRVVGIGASAGGLDAFTKLLKNLPADTGMAFVLVQHLSPRHQSSLREILAGVTSMAVLEVKDRTLVERNHVYVIPPNVSMEFRSGRLRLKPREAHERPHLPIDHFFRSLGEALGPDSIGVVLSGTGSDGAEGLKILKGEGGISFAQLPGSAKFGGMPERAIYIDHVDFVLPPEQIGAELSRISKLPLPSLTHLELADELPSSENTRLTDQILQLIKQATGVDFLLYKRSTVQRRIQRRMSVHKADSLARYYAILVSNRAEQLALVDDILINVTSFFRDSDVFEKLAAVVFPALIQKRPVGEPIRIWVAGCATGEEAYSVAIVLLEVLGDKAHQFSIQIFASDLSESCIAKARAGKYTDAIAEQVSAARLARFFVKSEAGYRVSSTVRDLVVFAKQDLINDPPYSKLDLITCRNVLIYLQPPIQKKVLSSFRYALKPSGYLVLGSSETPSVVAPFFSRFEKKAKIYQSRELVTSSRPEFTVNESVREQLTMVPRGTAPVRGLDSGERETDRLIATYYAPPSVVVNEYFEVLQFRGDTSPFLANPTGRASFNLLKMAREGLAPQLKALIEAAKRGAPAKVNDLRVKTPSERRLVSIEVVPLRPPPANRCFLILFKAQEAVLRADRPAVGKGKRGGKVSPQEAGRIQALTQELAQSREYLESLNSDLESTNQDLQSANEEVLSANEELQSTNEEVETAKEELQSGNEELTTVNDELQNRNSDLDRVNNDLTNLLGSIEIPILMVGVDGRLRRITPAAEKALNLRESDIGRPLREFRSNFEVLKLDLDLEQKVAEVVATMRFTETEIQDREGRWFRLQIRPYRTLDNRIDGAVIALVDIDTLKRTLNEVSTARAEAEAARIAAESGNRSKDVFLATLSHELRTPLTTMLSYAQMLRGGKLSPEASKRGIMLIEQSAQAQLINDLLDVSRIIMGKLSLDLQEVDAVTVFQDVIESLRPSMERKSLQIDVVVPAGKVWVLADIVRLKQVLLNLLTNAIKFSSTGGRIEAGLKYPIGAQGELVQFVVRDFGKGISEKFLPHLFERFSQADGSSTRVHGGMGLGLTIVRSLAEAQGGSVAAESQGEGHGSTFTVTLPALNASLGERSLAVHGIASKPSKSSGGENSAPVVPSLEGIRILLVDDDHNARESLGGLLSSLGALVEVAESAPAALRALPGHRPDVVVSDLAMPGADGYSLIASIRKLPGKSFGNVPALALTAFATVEDVQRVKAAGFQAHLAKPVESFDLASAILAVLQTGKKKTRDDKN